MKKSLFFLVPAAVMALLFQSFISSIPADQGFPPEVTEVLKTSCYDCHSKDASNKKGTLALNFDKWEDYKLTKKISKLDAICEEIEEGKMPPAKYLKGNADKALNDEKKELICNWARGEADKLMEGN